MRGQGRFVLLVLAALGLLLARGYLSGLVTRLRLAFLAVLTVLALSLAVRGALSGQLLWAGAALALLLPSLVLAWRDFLKG